jgi:opacity protein-like surface antigen
LKQYLAVKRGQLNMTALMRFPIYHLLLWVFTVAVLAVPAFADAISVGIKAGVPLTDVVQTAGEIGGRPFQASVARFTVGPLIHVRLPHGLGVEFGAMYKRFDQEAGQYQVIAEPGVPYQVLGPTPYSEVGQSWEFPLVGQYRFSGGRVQPYLEAGVSFNRLSGVFWPIRTLVSQSAILQPAGRSESRTGLVIGAGIQVNLPSVHVIPGLRYTRYGTTLPWLPGANSVDFLVGFTF